MTANQIAYYKAREDARHNRVSEVHEHQDVHSRKVTAQAAERTSLANSMNAETNARNATTNWWAAQEQGRHNLETERVSQFSASALADYQLKQGEALLRQAAVSERQADTAARQALVAERNATVNERNLANLYRNSVANETQAQVSRLNAATRQQELAASISMNAKQVALGYSQLAETRRHANVTEAQNAQNIRLTTAETKRHNQAQEAINRYSNQSGRMQAEASASQATSASRNATSNRISAVGNVIGATGNVVSGVARTFSALR